MAMGFLEAVVVVYLRRVYFPGGFRFPLVAPADALSRVEIAREAATLMMILSVAMLAGKRGWDRFAAFMYIFGLWDIAYYAGLRATIGWPESLGTWDILFLIPAPWVAPVWAPAFISLLLVAGALAVWHLQARGLEPRIGKRAWAALIGSGMLVIGSFLFDSAAALTGNSPGGFAWPPYVLGTGAALFVASRSFAAGRSTNR